MQEIYFYKDRKGREPVKEFLIELSRQKSKDSRIQLNKINDYLQLLSQDGTMIGQPFVKYLGDDLWELRPLRNRIFFISEANGAYILLHHFVKKSQKTPRREICIARQRMQEVRGSDYRDQ